MTSQSLTLYDLAGNDPALRFSPHCWKTRMALAHKQLDVTCIPWRFTDRAAIAFSGSKTVPLLVDEGQAIADSWQIALHLESQYPDRPSLFGASDAIAPTAFINSWADNILMPALGRILLRDIHDLLTPQDQVYFRESRERMFKASLETVVAPREANMDQFRKALAPARRLLREQRFLGGDTPRYADYCVFGMFMWARSVSRQPLISHDDVLYPWQEQLLDAFDGLARSASTPESD